jgi:hypothetical protein
MSLVQAKEFIFRELDELAVQAPNSAPHWKEDTAGLAVQFGSSDSLPTQTVQLGKGIREILHRAAAGIGATCRLEFDRALGWDRSRAEEWINRHVGVNDLGRTARLNVPHRLDPGLAAFLADLLSIEYSSARLGAEQNGSAAHVEFVRVEKAPAANGRNGKRSAPAGPREGAGFELDLSQARNHDRLPAELRQGLPRHGFVNLTEAQAVVRTLETLVDSARPSIAVVALYAAQAELIRRLARASKRLDGIDIATPATYRHRESQVVLVSLTRSHTHRAVAFGEGPQALATALTRARSRLILFGDPGTLLRRTQWNGAVDHLDAATADRERDLFARLYQYVDGKGRHQRVFQARGC